MPHGPDSGLDCADRLTMDKTSPTRLPMTRALTASLVSDGDSPLTRVSQAIEALLTAGPGEGSLAATLAHLMGLDGVLLGELPPSGGEPVVNVIDGWLHGHPTTDLRYALSGTPCDVTVRRGWCVHPHGVAQAFPQDRELAEHGIEGYAGRVLHDRSGAPRGLLVGLSSEPLTDVDALRQMFTVFTPLALAELEHRLGEREGVGRVGEGVVDTLTGLGNRTSLYDELRSLADLPSGSLALAVLDINHFHEINEQLGHGAGDETLQSVASRLQQWHAPPARSRAYRLGGDEFVVLCRADPGLACDWTALFENLVGMLNEPMQASGHALSLTLSVGVAVGPVPGDPVDTLLWRADRAKRLARERGRSVVLHTPDEARSPKRRDLSLRADIRQAVAQQQFVLRYQPKVCPRQRTVVGLEALIRWPHPITGREVQPAEFIPFIETTAYIHPVTQWVLNQALADLASLSTHPALSVAVNISAKNLLDERLVAKVAEALDRTGVAAHRLELELTESSFLSSPRFARDQIEALAELGVRVSIDDFGTGFSSLSYLQDLPVHAIKVDQIFVRPLLDTPRSATIARAAVELAHALGMQAVAEGVESLDLVEPLAAMGYDALQGFAIARPSALHDALAAAQAWAQTSPLRIA
jgi:diguanylate cyclase (GGDEF)-like protein